MTAQRDPERLIRAVLDEGPTELPDRAYEALRAQIDQTRQRVVIGPWRESQLLNFTRTALVATAVVVVAVVGYNLLPGRAVVGGPEPPTTPVASASPAASPAAVSSAATATPLASPAELGRGELEAGTFFVRPFQPPNGDISFTFDVPAGWEAGGPGGRPPVGLNPTTGYSGPDGMSLGFLTVTALEADPCNWTVEPDVDAGETVDQLVSRLLTRDGDARSSYSANASPANLGGYSGQLVNIEMPAGLDPSTCDHGQYWVWSGDGADGQAIYAQGQSGRFHLWILDVQGERVIVMTHDFPATSDEDRAELQSIVDSVRIDR